MIVDFDEIYEEDVNLQKTDVNEQLILDTINTQIAQFHLLDKNGLIPSVDAYNELVELYNKYHIPFVKVKDREELMNHIDRLSYRVLRFTDGECFNLTELNLNFLDVSEVEDFSFMFQGRTELRCLDVSKWDTSRLRYKDNMFNKCASKTKLNQNR